MRTRRSLGDDPPATASASKPKAEATTAAQRRSSDRRTRTAPRQADPSSLADNASANGQGGAARESSEVEMNGHDHPDEPSGGDGEAAARSEVTSEIKGTTQLRKTSSFVAPQSPHPLRIQHPLPPPSQTSRTTLPAESHVGRTRNESQGGAHSSDEARAARSRRGLSGVGSSSGSKRKAAARRSDEATSGRRHSSSDRLPPSDAPAPHPTAVLRRPPAFELPDSSPLKREPSEWDGRSSNQAGESGSDVTAGANRQRFNFHTTDDDDALMLPAQEPVAVSNPYYNDVSKLQYWPDADVGQLLPHPPTAVSEESEGYPTTTRRNLLPDLLQAEYGDDSERSSPQREGRAPAPLAQRHTAEAAPGPSQRPTAIPVGLGKAQLPTQPALVDAGSNPFRTTALPHLGGHRRSHSMAGHERAATHSTVGGRHESSFLEADSFAARRLHSLTRPAKARDSLGMRPRAPRTQTQASPRLFGGAGRPPSVAAFGQAQILLDSADPCVCGFTGGKRRRLSALSGSDGRLSDDSLLSGDGKENSPASSGRLGDWEAHAKRCETLREMRAQGWRIYLEI